MCCMYKSVPLHKIPALTIQQPLLSSTHEITIIIYIYIIPDIPITSRLLMMLFSVCKTTVKCSNFTDPIFIHQNGKINKHLYTVHAACTHSCYFIQLTKGPKFTPHSNF